MPVSRCEAWTVTLKEEQRLRVFENRVLRKMFSPKRDEVTGECLYHGMMGILHMEDVSSNFF
jgi:hypothetical protein